MTEQCSDEWPGEWSGEWPGEWPGEWSDEWFGDGVDVTAGCPWWCRDQSPEGVLHAHVSQDVVVGEDEEHETAARMIQLPGSDRVRFVVGQSVVGLDEAKAFAYALLRLASGALPAEPGLGFVETLAARAGLSTGEMALAAGIDAARLRRQRSGGRVLSEREFDRLALAVAQLYSEVAPSAGVVGA